MAPTTMSSLTGLGTILVGTAGQGVLRSSDSGTTWSRIGLEQALEFDAVVRCLAVDPTNPATIYAGADVGLARSDDAGATWTLVPGPMEGFTIWSIAIDASNPQRILLGSGAPTRARLFRSLDGGKSFETLSPELPERCAGVSKPRILAVAWDGDSAWFGVEEGGLWRSPDGGDTWARLDVKPDDPHAAERVTNSDIHSITIVPEPRTIIVVVVNAIFVSRDDGRTWTRTDTRQTWGIYYTRLVAQLPGGTDLILGIGDATPGTQTRLFRSEDLAATWVESTLDQPANSTTWAVGSNPANPSLLFAGTKYGHLYRSDDAGRTWTREWREFPEITAVAWTTSIAPPNTTH